MKPIKLALWLFLIALTGVWLLADTFLPRPLSYFSFREVFVQYSGVIAIAVMSVAMLLAVRPVWMERPLCGLDKMYRLHKWLGISALVFAVLHWWWALGTKWMVGWGWLDRPQRRNRGAEVLSDLEHWLRSQRGVAEWLGEWTFYVAAVLLILALIKWFPYRWFKQTHKWLAVAYLLLVYHSAVLLKFDYWAQPIGWVVTVLMVVGSVSALLVLLGQVGRRRQVKGVIRSLRRYPGVHVIEGCIELEDSWPGHCPGQFAFVTSKKSEGAHPYTIASAWNPDDPALTFVIKQLGDWTGQLDDWLHVGLPVKVEGPYGCFDFNDGLPRQIWVGAGIGITPFIAKMKHLAHSGGQQQIDLFHTTTDFDQGAIDKLCADAAAANINLHLTVTTRDGHLTPAQIRDAVPQWREGSVWFCGPSGFGDELKRDFVKQGLPAARFHQELFAMR